MIDTTFSFAIGLLTAALSLMGFVQQHPELPQASRDQAQQVAQEAVTQANQTLINSQNTTISKSSIIVDVDGSYILNVAINNLPMSKIELVRVATKERFDIDNNVQGSDYEELDEHNKLPGKYYIEAIPHDKKLGTIKSEIFYLGR